MLLKNTKPTQRKTRQTFQLQDATSSKISSDFPWALKNELGSNKADNKEQASGALEQQRYIRHGSATPSAMNLG